MTRAIADPPAASCYPAWSPPVIQLVIACSATAESRNFNRLILIFFCPARMHEGPGVKFNRTKHFRGVGPRYEKPAANLLAMLKPAPAHLWMRHNGSMT